jgi:hypothetical protein
MKAFAAIVMLVALYLLYRIAYPPQTGIKKGDEIPQSRDTGTNDAVGESRYVSTFRSQLQTTPATSLNPEKQEEKAHIFAPENGKIDTVIPFDRLDEIFGVEQPDEDDLDIPDDDEPEESDENTPDADEESEELRQTLEQEAETELANGFSIEEMETAAAAIDSPTDENAGILYRVENTDMFEKLVSGDEGKRQRIASVIDRHVRSLNPEIEESESDGDYKNFNIADFLS